MPILKKMYLIMIPLLLLIFSVVGFFTYNLVSNHAKHMYLDRVQSDVNTALVAAEYEQIGLSLLVKNISSSLQFLRYIQTPTDDTALTLLEKLILRTLNQSDVSQFGQRHIYVIAPQFELTLSTLRTTPFKDLKIPDRIYERVFDMYISLINQAEQRIEGFSYISENGELRYAYVAVIPPHLSPQNKRTNLNRYILIADGPLIQLSNLLVAYNKEEHIQLLIEPSDKVDSIGKTQFIIKSFEQDKNSINVQMTSRHFFAQVDIQEKKFSMEKNLIAQKVFLGFFAILFLIMLLVHLVVRYHFEHPLKSLLHEISIGGLKLRYFKRSSGQSEIDGLKNAYIDSLTELKFEAEFDQLTKLANRRTFIRHLDVHLNSSVNPRCYLICWDIIDFRKINDLYGAKSGDNILISIAGTLRKTLQNHQSSFGYNYSDYSFISSSKIKSSYNFLKS